MPTPYTSLFSLTRILGLLRLGLRDLGFPPTNSESCVLCEAVRSRVALRCWAFGSGWFSLVLVATIYPTITYFTQFP